MNTIIFDFDGTLIDSSPEIMQAFRMVARNIIPEREYFIDKMIIGPTLIETAQLILNSKDNNKVNKFTKEFIKIYDNILAQKTKTYSGVSQTLLKLKKKSFKLSIVTNKRLVPTKKIVELYKWENIFDHIICSDSKGFVASKSLNIKKLLDKDSFYLNSFLLGDTINDGISANENNLKFIRAKYGYGKNEDWTKIKIYKDINKFSDILDIV